MTRPSKRSDRRRRRASTAARRGRGAVAGDAEPPVDVEVVDRRRRSASAGAGRAPTCPRGPASTAAAGRRAGAARRRRRVMRAVVALLAQGLGGPEAGQRRADDRRRAASPRRSVLGDGDRLLRAAAHGLLDLGPQLLGRVLVEDVEEVVVADLEDLGRRLPCTRRCSRTGRSRRRHACDCLLQVRFRLRNLGAVASCLSTD